MADDFAKAAAKSSLYAVDRQYLREATLAHLTRKATERRSKATKDWISSHIKQERRYRPPRGGKILPDLEKERKELASRYYQLLSGHAAPSQDREHRHRQMLSDRW